MRDSSSYKNVEDWTEHLLATGKYAFALREVRASFPRQSEIPAKSALKRLVDKKQIFSIHKGCYLIISPQYKSKGILPTALFLDAFMKEINLHDYLAFRGGTPFVVGG